MSEELVLVPESGLQVEYLLSGMPAGSVAQAVLMVKTRLTDHDSLALITKTITAVASQHGVISDATNSEGRLAPLLTFTIVPTETASLAPGARLASALKVWTNDAGSPFSPQAGRRGVRVVAPGVFQRT